MRHSDDGGLNGVVPDSAEVPVTCKVQHTPSRRAPLIEERRSEGDKFIDFLERDRSSKSVAANDRNLGRRQLYVGEKSASGKLIGKGCAVGNQE